MRFRALLAVATGASLSLVAVPSVVPTAAAATATVRVWDGGPDSGGLSVDARWRTASNWVGDLAPSPGDVLEFPNIARHKGPVNDFPAGTTFEAVRIVTDGGGLSGYDITGNEVVVRSALSAKLYDNHLRLPLRLGGHTTITSDGALALHGGIALDGHRLTLAGTGHTTLFGAVTGSAPAPAVVVQTTDLPDAVWSSGVGVHAPSSFTGGTRITSGKLNVAASAGVTWPGDIVVDGGSLDGWGRTGAVIGGVGGGGIESLPGSHLTVGSLSLSPTSYVRGAGLRVTGGTVSLGGARLEADAYWCGSCFLGMRQTIVQNETGRAIVGRFAGLPEKARFARNGVFFEITYLGRDGRDVEVRVVDSLTTPPPPAGYWMLGSTGAVHAFGDATHHGTPSGIAATNIAAMPGGSGYWVVSRDGVVHAYGRAPHLGDRPGLRAGETVSSLSPTPSGTGYWLFTSHGRAFAYGTARHVGDMAGKPLNGPVLGSVATPSGNGYYMVASDGGIFTFGDATFLGSMGDKPLNGPVVGLAPDPDGRGYWLVGSDGGIFSFQAPFRGSMGGQRLNAAVVGMVAYGDGYLMTASDGGIFSFSTKRYAGSLGGSPPGYPIVAVAALDQ